MSEFYQCFQFEQGNLEMKRNGTTRVYERGKSKTRLKTSSWIPSTPVKPSHHLKESHIVVKASASASMAADCCLVNAELHVLHNVVKCSTSEQHSDPIFDTCDPNNRPTVVRGGVSVPLPLHWDLNEVPEAVVDGCTLLERDVKVATVLECDLNEIPIVVADEVVSDHVILENVGLMSVCDAEVEKGEHKDGIMGVSGDSDVSKEKLVTEQECIGNGNKMDLQTPRHKVRRRKHRPKVLVDGYKPRVQKKTPPTPFRKMKERLPKKKKYVRLNSPQPPLSEIVSEVTEPVNRKSARRVLNYDSNEFITDDWYPSSPEDVNHFYTNMEARGKKREFSRTISFSIDDHSVEEDSVDASCDKLPDIPFLEISKRRRTTKGRSSFSSIECWVSTAKFLSEPHLIEGCLEEIQRIQCPTPQAKRSNGFARLRRLHFSPLMFKFFIRKSVIQDLMAEVWGEVPRKKRTCKRLSKGRAWSNIIKRERLYHRTLVPYNHQRFSFDYIGSAYEDDLWEGDFELSIDQIVERLQDLNINREINVNYRRSTLLARYNSRFQGKYAYLSSLDTTYEKGYALVPYRRDDALVPYIKKKPPRPRVDLDSETNRVWNLLLKNTNSPGIDGSDEETTRKWNDERNIFRQRANLFISRMHLIQGDRRFSPWKGSVLDSVIGVFLTQNVSDHLSSSAFMSLAAKFPLKLQSNDVGADRSNDRFKTFIRNSSQNSVIISHPEDDFENPVNSALALENYGTQGYSSDYGESAVSGISTNSIVLGTTEVAINIMDETVPAVDINISSQSFSDSFAQIFAMAGLPFDEIPRVSSELDFSVSIEGCHSLTCEFSEEMERKQTAALSDVISQGDLLSSTRGFEVTDIPINPQLHLTSDLAAESLEYIQYMEKGNPILDGSYGQSKEPISQYSSFTEHCQGACKGDKSDIGSCLCQMSETSNEAEFPPCEVSDEHAAVNNASRKREDEARKAKTRRVGRKIDHTFDWDGLRKRAQESNKRENSPISMDSMDYESLRSADVREIANIIIKRGMNAMLAERIQEFLNGLVKKHGSTNLEWLRDILPDQAKEYLLTVRGLGLKSVECVRLLTLHQHAFPVDTNVGRIAVRLGWVPLQPLPESLQLHLLEQYPVLESIQKHLWPRLCKLDQKTLYELHYQMITFGKVFCTKTKPNCNSCPMRGDCRHFASEFASSRLSLPSSKDKTVNGASGRIEAAPLESGNDFSNMLQLFSSQGETQNHSECIHPTIKACEPIIEMPGSPESIYKHPFDIDIEDIGNSFTSHCEDSDEIPTIKLNMADFAQNLQNYVHQHMEIQEAELSKALVSLTPKAASIPPRKLKNASGLRTEHQVYVLPDFHPLLEKFDKREPDDPSPYLLAIWTPGETAKSIQLPESKCNQENGMLCDDETCLKCNSVRESEVQIVRGTILIPCRTAMRGSFPLNGTYFQVNEVFADFHSSHKPIEVPRHLIWNLETRTVYFGTSVPTIFRGMVTERIQQCFWKGYICVRGFDKETRAPRPLAPRLHTAKSQLPKPKSSEKDAKPPRKTSPRKQFNGSRKTNFRKNV